MSKNGKEDPNHFGFVNTLDITGCNPGHIFVNETVGELHCDNSAKEKIRRIVSGSYLSSGCSLLKSSYSSEGGGTINTVCSSGNSMTLNSLDNVDVCLDNQGDITFHLGVLGCTIGTEIRSKIHKSSDYLPLGAYQIVCENVAYYPV